MMKNIDLRFGVVGGLLLISSFAQIAIAQMAPFNLKVTPLSEKIINGPTTVTKQGSFFVGGKDIESNTLSTIPAYAQSGTITVDQMYVRYQTPLNAKKNSVVLIHGCCLTGTTWETTPDGRIGWDEYFLKRGYPTYVIDQSGRGRSAVDATAMNAVKMNKESPDELPIVFAASHESVWAGFRFGPEYPKVYENMQYPIASQKGLWQQMVSDWAYSLPTPNPTVPALSQLAKQLNKTVLISHSQSGIYPFQAAAMSNEGISGIISIEPAQCPAADGDLTPYTKIPFMVMFGDYIERSPRWVPRLKACREFVQKTNQAGGRAELLVLPEIGIKGNTHMLMQDSNSIQIADILASWIEQRIQN
jgi:pimeloyl-ACP methyl ester carboxylesterase